MCMVLYYFNSTVCEIGYYTCIVYLNCIFIVGAYAAEF